jgi:hypothetical protein
LAKALGFTVDQVVENIQDYFKGLESDAKELGIQPKDTLGLVSSQRRSCFATRSHLKSSLDNAS